MFAISSAHLAVDLAFNLSRRITIGVRAHRGQGELVTLDEMSDAGLLVRIAFNSTEYIEQPATGHFH
jgi:hypothetical protein